MAFSAFGEIKLVTLSDGNAEITFSTAESALKAVETYSSDEPNDLDLLLSGKVRLEPLPWLERTHAATSLSQSSWRNRKLVLKGVPATISSEGIRRAFSAFGEIDLVELRNDDARIIFSTRESVANFTKACRISSHHLKILIPLLGSAGSSEERIGYGGAKDAAAEAATQFDDKENRSAAEGTAKLDPVCSVGSILPNVQLWFRPSERRKFQTRPLRLDCIFGCLRPHPLLYAPNQMRLRDMQNMETPLADELTPQAPLQTHYPNSTGADYSE
jgi:hypothetical protein